MAWTSLDTKLVLLVFLIVAAERKEKKKKKVRLMAWGGRRRRCICRSCLPLSFLRSLSHRLELEDLGAFILLLLLRRMASCSGDGRKA